MIGSSRDLFSQRAYNTLRCALVDNRHETMPRRQSPLQSEMVQGTLDMLILQTLVLGLAHGQTIAHAIERGSEDVLQVEHGSLYPALHCLTNRGWIAAFWGTSENNRKARHYRLTPEGKKQLEGTNTISRSVRNSKRQVGAPHRLCIGNIRAH